MIYNKDFLKEGKMQKMVEVLFYLPNLFGEVQENGKLTVSDGRKFLHVWGTHAKSGYAQGYLLVGF